ncbi:MAG: hypothetical protein IJH38_05920 [Clostridia bacterium]|nr:hypothetical protein [Clostridia bacterium]
MRTNEELLSAVHARAEARARVRRRRRIALMGSGAAACAMALIVLMARAMPALHERAVPGGEGALLQGSILADSGALGYAVVGIVAFLLGVAVTLFCVLLKRRRDGEEEWHDRER